MKYKPILEFILILNDYEMHWIRISRYIILFVSFSRSIEDVGIKWKCESARTNIFNIYDLTTDENPIALMFHVFLKHENYDDWTRELCIALRARIFFLDFLIEGLHVWLKIQWWKIGGLISHFCFHGSETLSIPSCSLISLWDNKRSLACYFGKI